MKLSNVENYWSNVGETLQDRNSSDQLIAGDNDLFYQYKRNRFLSKLKTIVDWKDSSVLEYGCGPGGNLLYLSSFLPKEIIGVDISKEMLRHAKINTVEIECPVHLLHNNGQVIEIKDRAIDIAFTSTVLQHNVDDSNVSSILTELARVSSQYVLVCEHTEKKRKQLHGHFVARTTSFYEDSMMENGFKLEGLQYLDIEVSYYVLGGIRKLFNRRSRREGESISSISRLLQQWLAPISKSLDPYFKSKREHTLMLFRRD